MRNKGFLHDFINMIGKDSERHNFDSAINGVVNMIKNHMVYIKASDDEKKFINLVTKKIEETNDYSAKCFFFFTILIKSDGMIRHIFDNSVSI